MPTPEQAVELLRMEGRTVQVIEPGELIEDVDGIPHSVGDPTVSEGMWGFVHLTGIEWEETARYLLRMLDIEREYSKELKKLFEEMLTINKANPNDNY